MKGFIYKVTNQVTGKIYIGQTRQTIEARWKQHLEKVKRNIDNTYFHNAIKKYGEEAFKIEVLEECNIEELDSKEIFYIAKFDTFANGYNLTIGGGGKRLPDVYNKYDEIKELYLSGFSSNWIAERFNVDKSTIVKILKGLGVKIRDNKFKINKYELNTLIEDYKNGCSFKTLGKRYDVAPATIKNKLIESGVDLRDRYRILNKDIERQQELLTKYLNGESASSLIKEYHCEWNTFKRILSKNGIEYNNKRDFKKVYKLNEKEFLKAVEMFKTGTKISEIAKHFKVDKCTIYSLFKRYQFNYLTI